MTKSKSPFAAIASELASSKAVDNTRLPSVPVGTGVYTFDAFDFRETRKTGNGYFFTFTLVKAVAGISQGEVGNSFSVARFDKPNGDYTKEMKQGAIRAFMEKLNGGVMTEAEFIEFGDTTPQVGNLIKMQGIENPKSNWVDYAVQKVTKEQMDAMAESAVEEPASGAEVEQPNAEDQVLGDLIE